MSMLSEALEYARRGWYVFPCREKPGEVYWKGKDPVTPPEKTPYISGGLNSATRDEDQITLWWKKWENALIGINAGKSGLFVIDIDKKHVNGLDTFNSWNINDNAGLHSTTPSGGIHVVFRGTGKSSTNAVTGIDTRGEGGYFIVPPSKIIKGEYVGEYKCFDDWSRDPGVIPDGLMGKLFPDKTIEYVRGGLNLDEGEVKKLSNASLNFLVNGALPGERNSTLFKVLADFKGCGYTIEKARETVLPVSRRIGLPDSEFENVLEHAYSKPRTSSIPDSIQEKIKENGKNVLPKITHEEQSIMEDAVLSCLMQDNTLIPVVRDIIGFDDFHAYKNRMIYKSIGRLYDSGLKADHLTVSTEIRSETDKVSLEDITKIVHQYEVNIENTITYANIIKEKSCIRKLESLMDDKEKYLKGKNLVEVISSIEKDVSEIALYGGAKSTNILNSAQAVEMVSELAEKIRKGEVEQLQTGITYYDSLVGGIYSNELIILAGRAGDGKSALALSLINNIGIKRKIPVVLFSLEMSTHETISRLVCQLTGLPFRKVYQGKLFGGEWDSYREAINLIRDGNIYFNESSSMTVPEIRSKIRKMKDNNVALVVIDQLEQIRGYEGQPPYIAFDKIAYDIKAMTMEFDIPIILNHQLNRNVVNRTLAKEGVEPELQDLNQAGEKPANQVWVIHHTKDEKGKFLQSKIKILKNRNGVKTDIPLRWIADRMLFTNPTHPDELPPLDKNYTSSREDSPDDFGGRESSPYWAKESNE